ncbi:MAG: RNA polymerase sigma factor, partial [Acutalibacteraceae bacterium]
MQKQDAEKITAEYLKPIYSFALKRCKTPQDAEDISQEIMIRVFKTLIKRNDIEDISKYIWTVAHNALANYYRDSTQNIGISIGELSESISSDKCDISAESEIKESVLKLQSEIAYLSKLQRRIVIAYYYENKKQAQIAKELNIPLGTVKWHLFESKKELKRGMETMRTPSELKFNPVKLVRIGISGSVGRDGNPTELLRGALAQNIVYSAYREPKTVNQIAEDLGVSPVYVESEAEALAEFGFLIDKNGKYLGNILLDEQTEEINSLHNEMYEKVAYIFANELFDKLINSNILDDEKTVVCNRIIAVESGLPVFERDKNFMMWSLIPYITASSGEGLISNPVDFDEVAVLRPDGGKNICYAAVYNPSVTTIKYSDSIDSWFGPCWNADNNITLWQIDSIWSKKRIETNYQSEAKRVMSLLKRFFENDTLNRDEYAFLSEKGMVKVVDNENGFWAANQAVWIRGEKSKERLIKIGDQIKKKHFEEFEELKADYCNALLKATPRHMQKAQEFSLQYLFSANGFFILNCIKALLNNGKLKPPTEEQRNSLTTV